MPKVTDAKLTEFTPDDRNANRGTERGHYMLETSLEKVGAGRGIVVDKHGKVIAGNKTQEIAIAQGIEDAIVVETDGTQLVVTKRTDMDLDDPDPNNPARQYAYLDNRAGEVGLEWDGEQVALDLEAGFDFSVMFEADEFEAIVTPPEGTGGQQAQDGVLKISPELLERHDYLVFYFDNEFDWQVACEMFEVGPVLDGDVGKKTIRNTGTGRVMPGSRLLEVARD